MDERRHRHTEAAAAFRVRPPHVVPAVVATLVLLWLVAAFASGSSVEHTSGVTPHPLLARVSADGLIFAAAAAATLGIVKFVSALLPLRRSKRSREPEAVLERPVPSRSARFVAVLVVLLAVGGVAALLVFVRPGRDESESPADADAPGVTEPAPTTTPPPASRRTGPSVDALAAIAAGGLAVGLATLGLVVVRRAGGHRAPAPKAQPRQSTLTRAIDLGLDELRAHADPREAVVAAYAPMEEVLGAHGAARRPAEAPFEYLGRVLVQVGVHAESAGRLTELFERAAFSRQAIGEPLRRDAVTALARIHDEVTA